MTYIAFKLQFYILAALAFPGNRTHDLGVASTMLYYLSYRKAILINDDNNIITLLSFHTCMTFFFSVEHKSVFVCFFCFCLYNIHWDSVLFGPHWLHDKWPSFVFHGKKENHAGSFGTMWWWVNDKKFNFWVNYPFKPHFITSIVCSLRHQGGWCFISLSSIHRDWSCG